MVLENKRIVAGLVATLFSLSGCGDRGQEKLEGHVYYADGVAFGVTIDTKLNENGQYNIANKEGKVKGTLSVDHLVYDYQGALVGNAPCAATTEDAYSKNGFLVGSCTLDISSVEALRGLSAYEIAVRDGFVGTEEEWLTSLQGENGENPKGAPEYICIAGDTDSKCGINQNDYKISQLIFSRKNPATNEYRDGGLNTQGIIFGETDSINWEVQRTNGTILPAYTIVNRWDNGAFASNTAPYASHDNADEDRFRLISKDNALVLESEQGNYASVSVSESGEMEIVNSGLTIEHDKVNKEICFTAEKTSCISYLVFWEPK